MTIIREDITAIVLAGGRAQRMEGADKGLVSLNGRPLIEYVLEALTPQVGRILISANRNLDRYREYGHAVIPDDTADFPGPLAGYLAGLRACDSPYLLVAPCDGPFIPYVLASRLAGAMESSEADVAVAHDGERAQRTYALLSRRVTPGLEDFIRNGGHKVGQWYEDVRVAYADFSDMPEAFANINSFDERNTVEMEVKARD